MSSFYLLSLTKVMFVSNIQSHPFPFLQPPTENTEIATLCDTMRHYFARFRLKICYCSWPPKVWKIWSWVSYSFCILGLGHCSRSGSAPVWMGMVRRCDVLLGTRQMRMREMMRMMKMRAKTMASAASPRSHREGSIREHALPQSGQGQGQPPQRLDPLWTLPLP